MAIAEGQEAGLAFVSFLKASKVPESLWEQLLEKIERGEVGCQGVVQVLFLPFLTPPEEIITDPLMTDAIFEFKTSIEYIALCRNRCLVHDGFQNFVRSPRSPLACVAF